MPPASPQPSGRLVYCQDGEANDNITSDSYTSKEHLIEASDAEYIKGESMYVTLFEEMVNVVLQAEDYLFDSREITCFDRYAKLSYPARYLFIRLCLRKNDQWIRLGDLKYQRELGENIVSAMHELCSPRTPATVVPSTDIDIKVKTEERDDIIDLTADEEVNPDIFALIKQEDTKSLLPGIQQEPDYSVFADGESRANVRDLLECLRVDELREVVKEMKVPKTENKRDALINVLLHTTSSQRTLPFPVVSSAKGKRPKKLAQAALTAYMPQKKAQTQQDRLRAVVIQKIGACIRLNPETVKLFRRVNVVYFRSTLYSPTLLTDAILARCKKRNFEPVLYERSARLWESRDALLQYEAALEWEAQIDEIWGVGTGNAPRSRSRSAFSKTPAPRHRLRSECSRSPSKRGLSTAHDFVLNDTIAGDPLDESPRTRDAREVKAIFEKVYPLWCEAVVVKGNEDPQGKGLERFHYGHVLTRIVCKGADALGILKEHEHELEILEELLAQRRWRRARRGRWHERRALILMTHFPKDEETHRVAYNAVIEALQDNDTHIVYRPKLLRRLKTMEKRLKVPEDEVVQCLAALKQAAQETIHGIRVWPAVDATGKLGIAESKHSILTFIKPKQEKLPSTEAATQAAGVKVQIPRTGKSVWKGRDNEEVNVETFALQHYESLNYKGFHCEGRIVTTIFGLLFWDVIFAPIPGAFETLYQIAPLDIAEETFYTARQELIQDRLCEIRDGKALELLTGSYDQYSDEKRSCVGVRWDLFERQDLVEIVQCLDAAGLAAICQTVAEDYGNRTAGVPDLIIWNKDTSTCKFVEVKGPGDNLQENQKLWIDVLLQAGIPVEVCRVYEEGEDGSPKKAKVKPKKELSSTAKKRKHRDAEENVPESEDEEVDYSQLDPSQDMLPLAKPAFPSSVINTFQQVEVLLTPRKKRRQTAD
ncbi:VRR-NUC domain-containing protein [Irpex rosettiformis]|uniref:VRR-NUC domain-containing protein n=1 Tax=Irpex rosettiformis TaxID=378272 RepID=A0ACB8TWP2_9APHY|nr:VRR-NUC domain-containing protein [Irpex rosettiformis]